MEVQLRDAKGNAESGKLQPMKLETGAWTQLRAEGTVKTGAEERLDENRILGKPGEGSQRVRAVHQGLQQRDGGTGTGVRSQEVDKIRTTS